jgi:antitoxin Phd
MSKNERVWSLQEAKAKFSEVIRRAQTEGTQTVTLHGKPVASISPINSKRDFGDEETGQVIVDALRKCPVKNFKVPRIRDHEPFRDVEI